MKRVIRAAAGLALVAGIGLAPSAIAGEPSEACADGDVPGVLAQTDSSVTVCITEGPVTGSGTLAGDADTAEGYAVADGDSTNEGPLVGYIGIQTGEDGLPEGTSSGCEDPYEYRGEAATPEGTIDFILAGGESDCD